MRETSEEPLFHRVVATSGLAAVIATSAIGRALLRAGVEASATDGARPGQGAPVDREVTDRLPTGGASE